jgi:queuine tRNA-ribosyltransferase
MGVGRPSDLVDAVAVGVDLFDCVLPTRHARTGQAFTRRGVVVIRHAAHARAPEPLDPECPCYTCRCFSRAYLRHLFLARELAVYRLLTLHNLTYYLGLMAALRAAVVEGTLAALRRAVLEAYGSDDAEPVTAPAGEPPVPEDAS